ncbi:Afadin and alpha-actinin-binding-domain-containing protein [Cladochytrium replicatum]|nr:Afadin and alpha-actinin-binding-domain-containing protein [Cladochytrium replicatum]
MATSSPHRDSHATTDSPASFPAQSQGACQKETSWTEALRFIQHKIDSFGFPSFPSLPDPENTSTNNDDIDVAVAHRKVLNCVFSMLDQLEKVVSYRDEIKTNLREVRAHAESTENLSARQKGRIDVLEKEKKSASMKIDALTRTMRDLTDKSAVLRDELKQTKSILQQQRAQFQHDLRRTERELTRCKERLVRGSDPSSRPASATAARSRGREAAAAPAETKAEGGSMKMSGTLKPMRTKSISDQELGLYETVIKNYEDRERVVVAENSALRGMLAELYGSVRKFRLGAPECDEENELKIEFSLPMMMGERFVRARVNQAMKLLAIERNEGVTQTEADSDDDQTKVLEKELAHCKALLEQQLEKEAASRDNGADNNDGAQNHTILQQFEEERQRLLKEQLKAEERLLERERDIESERQKFLEAVVRLGKERAVLEYDREEFENERQKLQQAVGGITGVRAEYPQQLQRESPLSVPLRELPRFSPSSLNRLAANEVSNDWYTMAMAKSNPPSDAKPERNGDVHSSPINGGYLDDRQAHNGTPTPTSDPSFASGIPRFSQTITQTRASGYMGESPWSSNPFRAPQSAGVHSRTVRRTFSFPHLSKENIPNLPAIASDEQGNGVSNLIESELDTFTTYPATTPLPFRHSGPADEEISEETPGIWHKSQIRFASTPFEGTPTPAPSRKFFGNDGRVGAAPGSGATTVSSVKSALRKSHMPRPTAKKTVTIAAASPLPLVVVDEEDVELER